MRRLAVTSLSALVLASASPAWAGFGRPRSGSEQGSSSNRSPPSGNPAPARAHYYPYGPIFYPRPWWWGPSYYYYYAPPPVVVIPPPAVGAPAPAAPGEAPPAPAPPPAPSISGGASATLQSYRGAIGAGFTAMAEGQLWGGNLDLLGLVIHDAQGYYNAGIGSLNASYAFLSGERGRLRLELGGMVASTSDVSYLGPDFGLSGVLWLAGPLSLEGGARVVPFPYRAVDARVGLSLALGPLIVRGGYRQVYLNDGQSPAELDRASLAGGPFIGLALGM